MGKLRPGVTPVWCWWAGAHPDSGNPLLWSLLTLLSLPFSHPTPTLPNTGTACPHSRTAWAGGNWPLGARKAHRGEADYPLYNLSSSCLRAILLKTSDTVLSFTAHLTLGDRKARGVSFSRDSFQTPTRLGFCFFDG